MLFLFSTELTTEVIPYADSLGMNEQELPNLYSMLKFGNITLASDSNPRIAVVLGTLEMRGQNCKRNPLTSCTSTFFTFQIKCASSSRFWARPILSGVKPRDSDR